LQNCWPIIYEKLSLSSLLFLYLKREKTLFLKLQFNNLWTVKYFIVTNMLSHNVFLIIGRNCHIQSNSFFSTSFCYSFLSSICTISSPFSLSLCLLYSVFFVFYHPNASILSFSFSFLFSLYVSLVLYCSLSFFLSLSPPLFLFLSLF